MKHVSPLLSIALAFSLAACGSSGTDYVSTPSSGGGPLYEIEPNDDVEHADYLGEIRPGDFIAIEGHIRQCCGSSSNCCLDEYDGFAVYALEPVSVVLTLTEYTAGTDLDFAIFLPEINSVVEAFETDNHPEVGVFNFQGPGEFHVVINSYMGDSSYLLEFDVQPLFAAGADTEGPLALGAESTTSEFTRERYARYASVEPSARIEPLFQAEEDAGEDSADSDAR